MKLISVFAILSAVPVFGQVQPAPSSETTKQLLKVSIQLQVNSVENYVWYGSQKGSKAGAKDQFDSKTEIQQYYGDSGSTAIRGKARALIDDVEFAVSGALDIGNTSFMKAINVKTRGQEKFYELIVPEAADLAFLGNDQELKKKCFPHLKPASTLWRVNSKQIAVKGRSIAPRAVDQLVSESVSASFSKLKV